MKTKILPPLILCLLLTANCTSPPNAAPAQALPPAPLTQWEYKVLTVTEFIDSKSKSRVESELKLNRMGAQGWELVGFDSVTNPVLPSGRDVYYYLRRPKTIPP